MPCRICTNFGFSGPDHPPPTRTVVLLCLRLSTSRVPTTFISPPPPSSIVLGISQQHFWGQKKIMGRQRGWEEQERRKECGNGGEGIHEGLRRWLSALVGLRNNQKFVVKIAKRCAKLCGKGQKWRVVVAKSCVWRKLQELSREQKLCDMLKVAGKSFEGLIRIARSLKT